MIEYRRLEGELDPNTSTKIEAFILDAYGERALYKYPHRFSWLYGHERAFSLTAWDGDKVIGFVGAMPITLVRDGQALSAAWSVDNIVLSRYRGQGIGTALQRLAEAEEPLTLSTWVSISNLRIKERLGNIKIGQLVTLANKQLPLRYEKYDVEHPEADRISAAASKAVRSNDLYVKRDVSYCKWRFLDQPYSEYRLLSTRWGIALLRKCGPMRIGAGIIGDVLSTNGHISDYQKVIRSSLHYLLNNGCHVVRFGTSDLELVHALSVSDDAWAVKSSYDVLASNHYHPGPTCRDPFFSLSDSDLDQYPW